MNADFPIDSDGGSIANPSNSRNSILLVDDDPVSNFIFEKTLAKLGVSREVHCAVNGREALRVLSDRFERGVPFPAIILLDLNMPVMDGFTFLEAFRSLTFSNLEKIRIVIVTSSENRSDMLRAESLGVTEYVVKPLMEEDIRGFVSLSHPGKEHIKG